MSCQLAMVVFALLFQPPSDPTKDAAKRELQKLQGVWILIGGEEKGRVFTEEDARKENEKVIIRGNQLIHIRDETKGGCTIRLNPSKKPAWLDLIVSGGEELKGYVNHAIYSLDGDRLTTCVSRKYGPNTP